MCVYRLTISSTANDIIALTSAVHVVLADSTSKILSLPSSLSAYGFSLGAERYLTDILLLLELPPPLRATFVTEL